MNAQEYLEKSLQELKIPSAQNDDDGTQQGTIRKLLLSKKFRKYSISDEVSEHVDACIKFAISNSEPIKITMPYGAYKIWRIEESPEVDWAELFTMIYYIRWLKPICSLYKPGVWFDFLSDEVIVPRLNNYSEQDMRLYESGFKNLLQFIAEFKPDNLSVTVTRVRDRYDSADEFEKDLAFQLEILKKKLGGGFPKLSDEQKANLDFNVNATVEQKADPQWREKVQLLHDAYANVTKRRPYYREKSQYKIMAFPAPINGAVAVGSTKDTVTKFWTGAGVLKPKDDSYRQLVLSPARLEKTQFIKQPIQISDLTGKNFKQIKIISS